MKYKFSFLLTLICLLKREITAEVVFSFNLGAGIKSYEQSISLPMGSAIYTKDTNYFLDIGPSPLFTGEEIDPICNAILKTIPKIEIKTIEDRDKVLLNRVFNKVIISVKSFSIPFTAKVEYEFFNKLRFGIGATMEMNVIKNFNIKIREITLGDQIKLIRQNKNLVTKIFANYFSSEANKRMLIEHLENCTKDDLPALLEVVSLLDNNLYPGNIKSDLESLIKDLFKKGKLKNNNEKEKLEKIIYKVAVHFTISPFMNIAYKLGLLEDFDLFFEYRFYPMVVHLSNFGSGYSSSTQLVPKFSGNHHFGIVVDHAVSEFFAMTYGINFQTSIYTDTNRNTIFPLRQNSTWHLGLEIGVSFKIPDYERCYIRNCNVKQKHRHEGKLVRGVHMYTGRDNMGNKNFTKKVG